jgi:hypothetical protein
MTTFPSLGVSKLGLVAFAIVLQLDLVLVPAVPRWIGRIPRYGAVAKKVSVQLRSGRIFPARIFIAGNAARFETAAR